MKRSSRWMAAVVLCVVIVSCRTGGVDPAAEAGPEPAPRIVQPGSPGEASRTLAEGEGLGEPFPHTEADVEFMQGMIHHHAQAIAMTDLARTHASEDVRRMALRIALSQDEEIKFMQEWLRERDEDVPSVSLEHMHHMMGEEHEFMPGMLTHEQMAQLAAARGVEFDRLFLEFMIHHHQGALIMVQELFASEGAAYEVKIHEFASHVEADQEIEIRRMWAMLQELR